MQSSLVELATLRKSSKRNKERDMQHFEEDVWYYDKNSLISIFGQGDYLKIKNGLSFSVSLYSNGDIEINKFDKSIGYIKNYPFNSAVMFGRHLNERVGYNKNPKFLFHSFINFFRSLSD